MHSGLKIVVTKIQLDVDVMVFLFSCLCCESAPLRSAFVYVIFKYLLRLSKQIALTQAKLGQNPEFPLF
jgi:hypothetical protein